MSSVCDTAALDERSDAEVCAKMPQSRQYKWNSFPNQGVPERYAVSWKNKSDEPRLTSAIQTRRPQRLNPLPIQNSARIRWFLLLEYPQQFSCCTVFGQPTASFSLAHPYMENPACEEGFGRSFSSGAERAGASALSGASGRD